jgi:hypothetical protein
VEPQLRLEAFAGGVLGQYADGWATGESVTIGDAAKSGFFDVLGSGLGRFVASKNLAWADRFVASSEERCLA